MSKLLKGDGYKVSKIKESGIYRITNLVNGKIYIGSTTNFDVRFNAHRTALNNEGKNVNLHLASAWKKYGEDNFVFEIIERVQDKNLLIEREQYHMDRTLCYDPKVGYNKRRIAENNFGIKFSESTIRKMRERMKSFKHSEETIRKIRLGKQGSNHNLYGTKRSEESKRKTSKTLIKNRSKSGVKHHNVKLNEIQVKLIKSLLSSGDMKGCDIAKMFNVPDSLISRIKNGSRWKHVT